MSVGNPFFLDWTAYCSRKFSTCLFTSVEIISINAFDTDINMFPAFTIRHLGELLWGMIHYVSLLINNTPQKMWKNFIDICLIVSSIHWIVILEDSARGNVQAFCYRTPERYALHQSRGMIEKLHMHIKTLAEWCIKWQITITIKKGEDLLLKPDNGTKRHPLESQVSWTTYRV